MNTPTSNQLVLREYPWVLWLVSLLTLGSGLLVWGSGSLKMFALMLWVAGLLAVLLAPVTTLTADRPSSTLTIRRRSPIQNSVKEWPFNQIQSVEVETSPGDSEGGPTHRIVFVLAGGERVPLHSYYSSGYASKAARAGQMAALIGCPGPDRPGDTKQAAFQAAGLQAYQALKADITAGISWKLERAGGPGEEEATESTLVTRWSTDSYRFTPGFILVFQMPPSGFKLKVPWFQEVSNQLWKLLLKLYGFNAEDTPGIESAQPLPLDSRLAASYQAITSAPAEAQLVLTPWVTLPLADWAQRHPLAKAQAGVLSKQLTALLSPNGVFLAVWGWLDETECDELVQTGLSLVSQLGPGRAS